MLAVAAEYGIAQPVLAGSSMGSASALYAAIQRVKLMILVQINHNMFCLYIFSTYNHIYHIYISFISLLFIWLLSQKRQMFWVRLLLFETKL